MNELYWITRLDGINALLITCTVLIAAVTIIAFLTWVFYIDDDYEEKSHKNAEKILKRFFPALIISSLLFVFIPTKKDALLIWGIGGTVDFLKSNDTAKQIPDKCIDALDKFVSEYLEEDENLNNKND